MGGSISATLLPALSLQLRGSFMGTWLNAVLGVRPTLQAVASFNSQQQPADSVCPTPWNLKTIISGYLDVVGAYSLNIDFSTINSVLGALAGPYTGAGGGDISFPNALWTSPQFPIYAGCPLNSLITTLMSFVDTNNRQLMDITVPPNVTSSIPDLSTLNVDVISSANLQAALARGLSDASSTLAGFLSSSSSFEVVPRDSLGNGLGSMKLPQAVSFALNAASLGLSNAQLSSDMYLAYFDTLVSEWVSASASCEGQGVNPVSVSSSGVVTGSTCHFTQYALTNVPPPSPFPSSPSSAASSSVAAIAGGITAGIVVFALIGVAVYRINRRQNKADHMGGGFGAAGRGTELNVFANSNNSQLPQPLPQAVLNCSQSIYSAPPQSNNAADNNSTFDQHQPSGNASVSLPPLLPSRRNTYFGSSSNAVVFGQDPVRQVADRNQQTFGEAQAFPSMQLNPAGSAASSSILPPPVGSIGLRNSLPMDGGQLFGGGKSMNPAAGSAQHAVNLNY